MMRTVDEEEWGYWGQRKIKLEYHDNRAVNYNDMD